MADNVMLRAALAYAAEFGWPVLPLKPRSKEPLTEHGSFDATTDSEVIKAWWKRWPRANVGIATGRKFFVGDVDAKNGGDESLESLELKHGKLPDTRQQQTGGGGRQYLFTLPDFVVHNSESAIAPGIDVRGVGGYIVAPPSIHPNGRQYVWDGLDPVGSDNSIHRSWRGSRRPKPADNR